MKDLETERILLWIKAAGVRALKTFAQTFVATIGAAVLVSDVDWVAVLSASLLAAILSVMTSVAGLPEVKMELEIEEKEASGNGKV